MLAGIKINKRYKKMIAISVSSVTLIVTFLSLISSRRNIEPNIILITLDALRADHIGCYGYKKKTTPFLDFFSEDAFIFINAVAQSASTVPSIPSIITSKYPYSDCVIGLGNRYINIAEFLKQRGYKTYGIVAHYYASKRFGFSYGFDYFDDNFYNLRSAEETRICAIKLLEEIDKNQKFFMWLHFREPHSPYTPPAKYRIMFSEPFTGGNEMRIYTIYGKSMSLSERAIHELITAYDANIRFLDDNLKDIFVYLQKKDLIRKTMIIITADHGESMGEHNIFDHNELFYGILRVPLIIKIPNSKGSIITYPVSLIDIFPTVIELLGYKKDMLKLNLRGKNLFLKRETDEIQFSEYQDRISIIKNNWRIFLNKEGNYELYNVKDDPLELNNLVSVEKEKYEFLKKKLNDLIKEKEPCTEKPKAILDKEDKEKLRSLGYIQ